jgi:ubiquinone/menaquinone biosynthesis C-methylase UbiE
MVNDPDPRWERFAAREPYFAVLTSPQFLRQNLTPENERAFFESGDALVASMFRAIELQLSPYFNPSAILEYGCGAGRLVLPLARRAARNAGSVAAVDRSPAMLGAARHEAERRGVSNVEFLTPGQLFSGNRTFDFITCYFVLQRLPPGQGLPLLEALLNRLTPKGVGVFHVPFRSTAAGALKALRWMRQSLPGANALVNAARGRPAAEPFVGTYTYDLARVFDVLQAAGIETMHVVFEPHEGLETALLYLEKPAERTATGRPEMSSAGCRVPGAEVPGAEVPGGAPIAVAELIEQTTIEALNQAAEAYFASMTNWDHQLTKPFSQAHEAPTLLIDMAVLMQGLQLTAGATVLDFGAGTGWFARFLTQLGCRVILLDVSETALAMAQELYRRQPVIGDRPAPEFLLFDGRTIPLPDASVDRVLSFHAFHHAPRPVAILEEVGRVLKPGGIAGFAEPGPRHSQTPVSQFEMRNYRVVENDVDVHALWRAAKTSGFVDVQLAVFHGPPYRVSLEAFEDFLAGGPATAPWVTSTRVFLRNARTFFLTKAGTERLDSRRAEGLACHIHAPAIEQVVRSGSPIAIDALVTNTGTSTWLPWGTGHGGVGCGAHLYDAEATLLDFDAGVSPIGEPAREIAPGETVPVRILVAPPRDGRYIVELDCVAAHVSWFAPLGSRPVRVAARVES